MTMEEYRKMLDEELWAKIAAGLYEDAEDEEEEEEEEDRDTDELPDAYYDEWEAYKDAHGWND